MKKNELIVIFHSWKRTLKTLLAMKLIIILTSFFAFTLNASVLPQGTRMSIEVKDQSIRQILQEIEEKSEYRFFYNDQLANLDDRIDFKVENLSEFETIQHLFEGQELTFKLMENNLILIMPAGLARQTGITGTVTDENGDPLPGVAIYLKGTTRGVITNLEGKYSFEVDDPSTAVLVFSYVGYLTQEITVGDQTILNVTMTEDIIGLEEVVVIGYGQMKRADVTGSVASVGSETLREVNKSDPYASMQGQIPGLIINSGDNKPGGGYTIRIRGSSTINSHSNSTLVIDPGESVDQAGYTPGENPLFVVDGMFMNDINFLNPNDIERIDVLKDASATAIYGARGSKGVVIIQTKKGKSGAVQINYDSYVGINQPYHLPRIYEGEEYVEYFKDAVVGTHYAAGDFAFTRDSVVLSDFLRPNELTNIANNDYTDWVGMMKKNGFETNHSLSLSGGTERTTYGLGTAYTKETGNFEGEDYTRYNVRGDISSALTDWLSVSANTYVAYAIRNEGSREGFRSCYRLRPTGTPYDANGDPLFFPLEGETFITNPLFEPDNIFRETVLLDYLGNLSVTITPVANLRLTSQFAPNLEFRRYGEYRGLYAKAVSARQQNTRAVVNNSDRVSWTWDNILNYNANLGDNHQMEFSFIYSLFSDASEVFEMQRRNFSTDAFRFYNIDAGSDIRTVTGSYTKQTLQSFTGRLHYSYQQKYLLTATARYDGASILAQDHKWALFPSAAVAWRMTEESFMQNQNIFNELKLRVSYGQTGSNGSGSGLRPLSSQSLIGNNYTNLGDMTVQTGYITGLANQDLTWEKTSELNVGLDYGILANRINGSIDVYSRETENIIFSRPLVSASGYNGVFENVGAATNKGVEFALNSVNVSGSDFRWNTMLNFAANKNEVSKLYGALDEITFGEQGGSYIHRIGEPVGSIYYYVWDGTWQLDETAEAQSYGQQPGQVKVKDLNGDGVIDAENDRTTIGVNAPKWTGGLGNTFGYRNLELTVFVYTSQGATAVSWFHRSHSGEEGIARFNGLKTNYWTPDNPSNDWFQPNNPGPYGGVKNYQDVSYTKVGYITLSYNLPQQMLSKARISRFRVYFTLKNPFIFTDYEGWNPENAARNSWGSAFMNRTYMFGLNVSLGGR